MITQVVIPYGRNEAAGNEMLTSRNFVERLKAAGIPVIGTLVIRGVEHGTLMHTNDKTCGHIFEWHHIDTSTGDGEDLFQ
jgi:hypothetical protein